MISKENNSMFVLLNFTKYMFTILQIYKYRFMLGRSCSFFLMSLSTTSRLTV